MNKLLALVLLLVIVSANLRGQTEQKNDIIMAASPAKCGCQGDQKQNPVTNSKKMISYQDYKQAIQALHNGIKLSN